MAGRSSIQWKTGIHGRTKRRLWKPMQHIPRIYVGMGNPNCTDVRHNVGMDWLNYFANKMDLKWYDYQNLDCEIAYFKESELILIKPKRYMNMHGPILANILNQLERPIEDCVIIHDCLNTKFGNWRYQQGKGHWYVVNVLYIYKK